MQPHHFFTCLHSGNVSSFPEAHYTALGLYSSTLCLSESVRYVSWQKQSFWLSILFKKLFYTSDVTVLRVIGIQSCLISHSLLWLCHSVHHYLVTLPLGTFLKPIHYSQCHSLALELIYLCKGYWDSLQGGDLSKTSLLSNLFNPQQLKIYFPQSNMTFLLIYLEVAANRVSPQVSAFDSFSKVLTLYSTITLSTVFHSCLYSQLSGQTCITTSKHLPHLVRYLGVVLLKLLSITLYLLFHFQNSTPGLFFFHVAFLKKKKNV